MGQTVGGVAVAGAVAGAFFHRFGRHRLRFTSELCARFGIGCQSTHDQRIQAILLALKKAGQELVREARYPGHVFKWDPEGGAPNETPPARPWPILQTRSGRRVYPFLAEEALQRISEWE